MSTVEQSIILFWRKGFDTAHIAGFCQISEADVYNAFVRIRENKRAAA